MENSLGIMAEVYYEAAVKAHLAAGLKPLFIRMRLNGP